MIQPLIDGLLIARQQRYAPVELFADLSRLECDISGLGDEAGLTLTKELTVLGYIG